MVPIEARDILPFVLPLALDRVPGHRLQSLVISACFPADGGELAARVASFASASRRRLHTGLVSSEPRYHCFGTYVRILLNAFRTLGIAVSGDKNNNRESKLT